MLNNQESEISVQKKQARMMMDKEQRVESLRADFYSLIDIDSELSKVFGG